MPRAEAAAGQEMRPTWLVQRLGRKRSHGTGPLAKAHRVFGGGMLGLSGEQWDVLDELFDIDYMGAAEYEFGEFPRALGKMLTDDKSGDVGLKLIAFKFEVARKDIKPNPMRRFKGRQMRVALGGPVTVYAIGRRSHRVGIEAVVRDLMKEPGGKLTLRDDSFIHRTLDPFNEWDTKIVGWFELNNGFFYFIDEAMWRDVAERFGLEAT